MPFGCFINDAYTDCCTPVDEVLLDLKDVPDDAWPCALLPECPDDVNMAFTLKLTKAKPTKANYEFIFKKWLYEYNISPSKFYYEYDSKMKLHVHGCVMVDDKFDVRKLIMPRCSILCKRVYDERGWHEYITKTQ